MAPVSAENKGAAAKPTADGIACEKMALVSAENKGGAAKPAADGTAALSPAGSGNRKFSPLSHLTTQSARFGLWEVMVYNPKPREREYTYEGKQRTSTRVRWYQPQTQRNTFKETATARE